MHYDIRGSEMKDETWSAYNTIFQEMRQLECLLFLPSFLEPWVNVDELAIKIHLFTLLQTSLTIYKSLDFGLFLEAGQMHF